MKFKVTYYDIDTDKAVTKDCIHTDYNTVDKNFSFMPVDNPPRIYKSLIIDHPIVGIYQNEYGLKIIVEGYQMVKSGGYWRTKTIIESVREED
jgi:hypothetical protein